MNKWRFYSLFLLLCVAQLAIAQNIESITFSSSDSLWKLKQKVNLSAYAKIPRYHHGLIPFQLIDTTVGIRISRFGFINAKGEPVIPATYDTLITDFEKGYAIVGRNETYNRTGVRRRKMRTRMVYGVILPTNKTAVPLQYYSVASLPEHLFLVQNFKKQTGVRNLIKEIIPCRYDFIDMPDSNYIFADLNGVYSVYNMKGALLFEGLKEVERITHDSLMLIFYHQYEIRSRNNKVLSTIYCDSITSCKPYSLLAFRNGIAYATDPIGKITNQYVTGTPCPFYRYTTAREKFGIDSLGLFTDTTRFPFIKKYIRVWEFRENYAKVEVAGRYGFIDTMGNVKISIQYLQATYYQEGFAHIMLKGKWAVIDGEEIIIAQPYYQYISPYRHGCAIARTGKKYYLLNRSGKEINKIPYDSIFASPYAQWQIWKNGVSGLADSTGHETLAPRYASVVPTNTNRYIALKDGKYGVIDGQENVIIPFAFDAIEYDEYNQLFLIHTRNEYTQHSSRQATHHPITHP